ncbi:MAG: transposase [Chloroflexi bacterium]|nr:transposase [Chloroflexota bacterium]
MAGGYRIFSDENYPYFVTCTIVHWLPVFKETTCCQIVLDSLAYLREHKHTRLNAFVVMPTHIHAILWPEENTKLSDVLRDFKRFTSRAISRQAAKTENQTLLAGFRKARLHNRASDVSQYQVWQEGSHPEAIFSLKFAQQKLDYIHENPARAGLVSDPVDWPYSSVRAYWLGETVYPTVDLLET